MKVELNEFVARAMETAVLIGVSDAPNNAKLLELYGTDGTAIMETLTEWAFANRHSEKGRLQHRVMCALNDAYHQMVGRKVGRVLIRGDYCEVVYVGSTVSSTPMASFRMDKNVVQNLEQFAKFHDVFLTNVRCGRILI